MLRASRSLGVAVFWTKVSHQMREPLGPLLFVLELLVSKESLSPVGVEMVQALKRGVEHETRNIEELLSVIEVWSPKEVHSNE